MLQPRVKSLRAQTLHFDHLRLNIQTVGIANALDTGLALAMLNAAAYALRTSVMSRIESRDVVEKVAQTALIVFDQRRKFSAQRFGVFLFQKLEQIVL